MFGRSMAPSLGSCSCFARQEEQPIEQRERFALMTKVGKTARPRRNLQRNRNEHTPALRRCCAARRLRKFSEISYLALDGTINVAGVHSLVLLLSLQPITSFNLYRL